MSERMSGRAVDLGGCDVTVKLKIRVIPHLWRAEYQTDEDCGEITDSVQYAALEAVENTFAHLLRSGAILTIQEV